MHRSAQTPREAPPSPPGPPDRPRVSRAGLAALAGGAVLLVGALVGAVLILVRSPSGRSAAPGVVAGTGPAALPPSSSAVPDVTPVATPVPTPPATFTAHDLGSPTSFYIKAADQAGDGKSVAVAEAVLTGTQGWLVIHQDLGGLAGPVIGVSHLLPSGISRNVTITLTQPLTQNSHVIPMLHVEDDDDGAYDFPPHDVPATAAGATVQVEIFVKVG